MLSLKFVIIANIMIKKLTTYLWLPVILIISACSNQQFQLQQPPTYTTFYDPCESKNLPANVQGINNLMREFDDASQLASNLPAQQLPDVISNMQRIRRAAEDIQAPACLETLKSHELNHMNIMIDTLMWAKDRIKKPMNIMIDTLLAFVGGADQGTLKNGLDQARQAHNLYSVEIVRLLGVTLAPLSGTPPAPNETEAPAASSTP